MKNMTVLINSVEKAKELNRIASQQIGEIDLISGRYTIDAKSIMGIFSLDLSKPIELAIHSEDIENVSKAFSQFVYHK